MLRLPKLSAKMPLPQSWTAFVPRITASRRTWRWLIRLAALAVVVPVVLQCLVAYVVGDDARLLPAQLLGAKNLLIVTAHPDDECLFFAPSILGVLDRNAQERNTRGALLVMSTGNNYGLGEVRKQELAGSCAALGIDPARCVALNRPELQDNPKVWWDTDLMAQLVREHVRKWDIDAIITFDHGGVSGHINHRAVSAAVRAYASSDAQAPDAWMVSTVSLWRKYTFLGDLPLTSLPFGFRIMEALFFPFRTSAATADVGDVLPDSGATQQFARKGLVANTWQRYLSTRQAFRSHNSQYSWDRHLYMVISRYVWFNDLVKVPRIDKDS